MGCSFLYLCLIQGLESSLLPSVVNHPSVVKGGGRSERRRLPDDSVLSFDSAHRESFSNIELASPDFDGNASGLLSQS